MITIKVPARICFYGDHQDYLKLPVIAGTIDRYINLKAVPNASGNFNIKLLDLNENRVIPIDDSLENITNGDYFKSAMAVLKEKELVFKSGYTIEIWGSIPINAGLSSSSALVVCWLRFLIAIQEKKLVLSDIEIGHLAYLAEVAYFNQPGGIMDQYTIAQGGMLYIDTNKNESSPLTTNMGTLVVAESGIAKQTLEVLTNARIYAQKAIAAVKKANPSFDIIDVSIEDYHTYFKYVPEEYHDYWYATIHNYDITKKAKLELQNKVPDIIALGKLMNKHQEILEKQIKNTPNEMVQMMHAAKEAGALGAKIIGSGGGGCMVAITDINSKDKVIEAFLASNATCAYEVNLIINEK